MFDRIFDFISNAWTWLIFWVILDEFEEGVILLLGLFRKLAKPGVTWILPFGIDVCTYETVVRQYSDLVMQSVTSKDNKSVSLNAILGYRITDIKKFILRIDDGEKDIQSMCYGIITDIVEKMNWDNIRTEKFNNKVFKECSSMCEQFCGVDLFSVDWSDKTLARQIRLL